MRRGEIRWYEFDPPDKRRSVLLLTRDSVLPYLSDVTIAPITTTIRGVASEIRLTLQMECRKHVQSIFIIYKRCPRRKLSTANYAF